MWAVALMWVGMLVVLGLLIWAGYALATGSSRRRSSEPGGDTGRARLLDERLARGEIDAAEYQGLLHLSAAGDDPALAGARGER
ncbi:MAG: SHOCT domain-containing protein [Actinomycetota bacterium]|nr:SHOCT domain-containing protein [Actinomycetota bacterium]